MIRGYYTCTGRLPGGIGNDNCACPATSVYPFPTCRGCSEQLCPEHYLPETLQVREFDHGGVAIQRATVYCDSCADDLGPEE